MIEINKLCVFIMVSSLISGCASLAPASDVEKVVERNGVDVLLIPAAYREVYFSPSSSNERHCRAPDPDFTVEAGETLNLGATLAAGNAENAELGTTQTATTLGGRTAAVLITRELMYRACELSSNINANSETTLDVYKQFIDAIERIASKGDPTTIQPDDDQTNSSEQVSDEN
jgi:hypothetical protein